MAGRVLSPRLHAGGLFLGERVRIAEKLVWDRMKRARPLTVVFNRHEDRVTPGIPDVSYSAYGRRGWIELKWLDCLPREFQASILRPAQRTFLLQDYKSGGHGSWVLLGLEGAAVMIPADQISELNGGPGDGLLEACPWSPWSQLTALLADCLSRGSS
jgi:hypothetical protein